ncbi:MAG TPA: LacI family DNA-binding transcriptional regulator [Microvirga sp.]|jgi:LacI family transcriptional regulator|nr:LacI family DNA-binding transcriptional regulator [Microvirga sp.]
MSSRATIIDIAGKAGVSKSTVSLVLSGSPLVKAETRARVETAMIDLGYVYNRGAASLRKARSNIVGMVINDLLNPFFAELAVGIERALQGSDYIPFIANTGENPARQAQVFRSMREHGATGIIVCPAVGTDAEAVDEITSGGIPVVQAMRRVSGANASAVIPDNRAGGARAVEHLVRLGHRRFAFLGGYARMSAFRERSQGLLDGLERAGIAPGPEVLIEAPPTKAGGVSALAHALALPEPPTAVLCFNDIVAVGAVHALAQRGLKAGVDMAVIGFDDIAEAQHLAPALTTVAVDTIGLGERAAQMLLRQIESGHPRVETYVGEARLIVRESCGAARAHASQEGVVA